MLTLRRRCESPCRRPTRVNVIGKPPSFRRWSKEEVSRCPGQHINAVRGEQRLQPLQLIEISGQAALMFRCKVRQSVEPICSNSISMRASELSSALTPAIQAPFDQPAKRREPNYDLF
jgi:hypothetical protein